MRWASAPANLLRCRWPRSRKAEIAVPGQSSRRFSLASASCSSGFSPSTLPGIAYLTDSATASTPSHRSTTLRVLGRRRSTGPTQVPAAPGRAGGVPREQASAERCSPTLLTRPELPLCPGSSANLGECVIGEPPTWLRSLAWHRGSGLQRNSSDFRRLNRMRSLLPRSFAISLTCPRRSLLECVRVSTTTSAEPSRGLSDRELFELSTNELRHLALGRRTRNTLR